MTYNTKHKRFFFFSSRRRHTRSCLVSWARRCVQETDLMISGIVGLSTNTDGLLTTIQNWQTDPVNNVVTSMSLKCPIGTTRLIDYTWPGSKTVCDCRYGSLMASSKKVVRQGSCGGDMIFGCKEYDDVDSIEMPSWRQAGRTLCIQRLSGASFEKSYEYLDVTGKCLQGYKSCGTGPVKYCVRPSDPCPINAMIVAPSWPGDPFDNDGIPIGDGYNLYISRTAVGRPLVDMQFNQQVGCRIFTVKSIDAGYEEYPFLNSIRDYCREEDLRFQLIDSDTEENYFNINKVSSVVKKLPGYTAPSEKILWKVFGRPTIPWDINSKCLESFRSIISTQKNFDRARNYTIAGTVFVGLVFLFTILYIPYIFCDAGDVGQGLLCCACVGSDNPCCCLCACFLCCAGRENAQCVRKCIRTTSYFFKVLASILCAVAWYAALASKRVLEASSVFKCGDDMTDILVNSASSGFKTVSLYNGISVFTMLTLIFADAFYDVYLTRSERKQCFDEECCDD
eukprot:TRINITY_DN7233_c0_g1_i7.p1 TRINITY_DN7233_c0_g1~~TRINITY_DN7233_c0_g1_i7.p1  ORF type:complete len:509 (+),score=42.20 TRINITY_DN7233_c0_g1_i7:16-1542(+)